MSLEAAVKQRVYMPLDDEKIVREGEIPITLLASVGPEPWEWVSTRGRRPDGGVTGRVLIGDQRFPDAGLVWSEEADGPVIYQIWVSPDMRNRGVGRSLLDIYRSMVSDRVVIAGPFSPSGRALARAYGARVIENGPSVSALKSSLMPPR